MTTQPVQNMACSVVEIACANGNSQPPLGTKTPTKKPTKLNAQASHSETSTKTRTFAQSSDLGSTGRCSRMSASSLLKRISPAEEATNIPKNMNVIPCK